MEKADTGVERLLEGVRRGDHDAFRALVQELTEPLYRYACSFLREADAAQDIVQQAFLRLYRNRRRLDEEGTLRGYCYRIVANLCRNLLRDRKLRQAKDAEAAMQSHHAGKPTNPEQEVLAREAWKLAEELPEPLREPILLHFGHGLSLSEVGQTLGIPKGTASTRVRTGLQQLREKLQAAVVLPPLFGLEALEKALIQAPQTASVAVPTTLVKSVETVVMASIATKTTTAAGGLILAAILLLAGGGVAGWYLLDGPPAPRPNATNAPVVVAGEAGDEPKVVGPAANEASETPSPKGNEPAETEPAASAATEEAAKTVPFTATIRGKVLDDAARPVAGVAVEAFAPAKSSQDVPMDGIPVEVRGLARSAADGSFELMLEGGREPAESPVYYTLAASSESFASSLTSPLWVFPGTTLEGVEIRVRPMHTVRGRVVEASDRTTPVVGATVLVDLFSGSVPASSIRRGGEPYAAGKDEPAFVSAVALHTNSEGRFEITAPFGAFANFSLAALAGGVRVNHSGFSDAEEGSGGSVFWSKPGLGEEEVEVLLVGPSGPRVSFRVSPAEEKTASVFLSDRDGCTAGYYMDIAYDEEKVYSFAGVPKNAVALQVLVRGVGSGEATLPEDRGGDIDLGVIELKQKEEAVEDVAESSGSRVLRGTVVDPEGKPVLGAWIELVELVKDGRFSYAMTLNDALSDTDGRFSMDLPTAGAYTLTVEHDDWAGVEVPFSYGEDEIPADVVLRLGRWASISGAATVEGRKPAPQELGATGDQERLQVALFPAGTSEKHLTESGNPWKATVTTAVSPFGTYAFPKVRPGTYTLRLWYDKHMSFARDVVVREGQQLALDLDLGLGGSVSGVITGRDGKPLADANISLALWKPGSFSFSTVCSAGTDAHGAYRFAAVPEGTYTLRLPGDGDFMSAAEMSSRSVTVENGSEATFDLDLSRLTGPTVSGKATVGGESLFKEAVLVRANNMTSMRSAKIGEDGGFELTEVEEGSYYLWFVDNKYSPKIFVREVVEITEEAPAVRIEKDYEQATISGKVYIQGAPEDFDYSTIDVRLNADVDHPLGQDPVSRFASLEISCNEAGSFSSPILVAESYRVVVSAKGYPSVDEAHYLKGDQVIDFVLGGTSGSIEIHLAGFLRWSGEKGESVDAPEGNLLLSVKDESGTEMLTGAGDAFLWSFAGVTQTISSLAAGTYSVTITSAATEPWAGVAEVKEGEAFRLDAEIWLAARVELKIGNPELSAEVIAAGTVKVFDPSGKESPLGGDLANTFGFKAADRTLVASPLMAGTWRIVVQIPGYKDFETVLEVKRSEVVQHTAWLDK